MRVALVIGHQQQSPGAGNVNYETNEFKFNQALAHDIENNFFEYNQIDEIVVVYRERTYSSLPQEINDLHPDLIVSLHCNAFNTQANGCEMLYYHKSKKGKEVARIFQNGLIQILDNKDRGIKAKRSEDRGGYLLRYTKAPAIICEPFFIDNDDEFLNANEIFFEGRLTQSYCECIDEALKYLKNI